MNTSSYPKEFPELEIHYTTALESILGAKSSFPERVLEEKTSKNLIKLGSVILSGISGAGKTTIGKHLEEKGYKKVPNVTTRKQRSNERADENVFIDEPTFEQWKDEGRLALFGRTNGVQQGILKSDIDRALKGDALYYLDKSVTSALKLAALLRDNSQFTYIYLLAPSFAELWSRLYQRAEEDNYSEEQIIQFISDRFEEEIPQLAESKRLPYIYLVNDTVERIHGIVDARI